MNEVVERKQETKARTVQPACSIRDEDGQILVQVEMPGVAKRWH